MILTCPACATRYLVDDSDVGAAGRRVACAACEAVWTAWPDAVAGAPPREAPTLAAAEAFGAPAARGQTEPEAATGEPEPEPAAPPDPHSAPASEPAWTPQPETAAEPARWPEPGAAEPAAEAWAPSPEPMSVFEGQAPAAAEPSDLSLFPARRPPPAKAAATRQLRTWIAVALVALVAAVTAALVFREPLTRAWPPAGAIFTALGAPVAASGAH